MTDQQDFEKPTPEQPATADAFAPETAASAPGDHNAANPAASGIDPHLMGQFGGQQRPNVSNVAPSEGPREPIRVGNDGQAETAAAAPAVDFGGTSDATADAANEPSAESSNAGAPAAEANTPANAYGADVPADKQATELDEALARSRAIPEDGDLNVPPADFSRESVEAEEAAAAAQVGETDASATAVPDASGTEHAEPAFAAAPVVGGTAAQDTHTINDTAQLRGEDVTPVATTPAADASANPDLEPIADEDRTTTEGLVMPPEKRGNRGFAVFIAVLASAVFAGLFATGFAAAAIVFGGATGNFVDVLMGFIGTAAFYVPVALFTIVMVCWSLLANRAGWWTYIIASFFLAFIAFAGYHLGIAAQDVVNGSAFSVDKFIASLKAPEQLPGALIAFIAARESALWIGGFSSLRGRRIKRKNAEAQAEYDRKVAEERELSVAV